MFSQECLADAPQSFGASRREEGATSRVSTIPDRPREILKQVFLILDADREPDQGVREAAAAAFLLGDGRVRHRGWMTNE